MSERHGDSVTDDTVAHHTGHLRVGQCDPVSHRHSRTDYHLAHRHSRTDYNLARGNITLAYGNFTAA